MHLVKKHELDILDIPIAFVTEKYLAYLDALKALDIDVAGEYLLMAATLCHLKSRQLLPGSDDDAVEAEAGEGSGDEDAPIDTRAELIRRLLEYQKYKDAATALGAQPVVGRNVWSRGTAVEDAVAEDVDPDAVAPLAGFPVHKLIEAFDRVMRQAKIKVTHNVIVDRLSVSQKIAELTDRLEVEQSFTFTSMFRFAREGVEMSLADVKHEAVVTFLALLEMAKLRLIALAQHRVPREDGDGDDLDDGEIFISRAAEDLRERVAVGIAGSDEYR
ncbi:MAG: segregation/condensation protein A [Kofleriaceae bacterium]